VLAELGPRFEREAQVRLRIQFGTSQALSAQIVAGTSYDVALLTQSAVQQLVQAGRGTQPTDIARSGIGIAVPAGSAAPDISTVPALKQALLNAHSVAYTASGASGLYFEQLLQQLDIAQAVNAKAKRPASADLPRLVAQHEVDLIVQQISELRAIPGTTYIGPLPAPVQHETVFSAMIAPQALDPSVARALVQYLTHPAAADVIRRAGMQLP